MAASVARITSTSSISTSVKALVVRRRLDWVWFSFIVGSLGWLSFYVLLHRKDRQDHADENGPDEAGDHEQHQRLEQCHPGLEIAIQIALGDHGDADEFGVELAAFFRHGNHFQR